MHKINDEALSKIFNTQPISDAEIVNPNSGSLIEIDEEHEFAEEDFSSELEFDVAIARKNIIDVINNSKEVLESAAKVAIDTEHPKVYESYSALLKSISDASTALVNIHVQKKAIQKADKKDEGGNVTNNNTAVFVGTPAELSKLLKQGKDVT